MSRPMLSAPLLPSRLIRLVVLLALVVLAPMALPRARDRVAAATQTTAPAQAPATATGAATGPATATAAATGAQTSGADAIKARYTKYEYQIPMRDGVKLFTSVYAPKDAAQPVPIMLQRTPYSVDPYGPDAYRTSLGPSELFSKDGFIFVYQDVRGRYMSEGEWLEMTPHRAVKRGPADVDESSDTYDTIAWLLTHLVNHNGRVGLWGVSYPGFYAAAGMIDAHPALKAVSPQAPIADLFMGDDSYHNGAFMLAANFGFYASFVPRSGGPQRREQSPRFDFGTPDGYDFYLRLGPLANSNARYLKGRNPYWTANIEHTTYDEFWKTRSIVPHLKQIVPAVLTVGGWFDAEDLAGPLAVYRAVEKTSHGRPNLLVMGPWPHGGWARSEGDRLGNLSFDAATSRFYREQIEFPFFAHYLKDRPLDEPLPEAFVFETGANQWRRHEAWPPKEARPATFYFRADGVLGTEAPPTEAAASTRAASASASASNTTTSSPSSSSSSASASTFDEYVSDPNRPVPFVGYTTLGMTRDYMTEDQRFAATRPDVLVYATEPLEDDLTIVGPIKVDLQVSTTGTDADWVVKVIDVYPNASPSSSSPSSSSPSPSGGAPAGGAAPGPPAPNAVRMGGYQQLVRGEPFRGKFRNSFEKPEPFTPNQPTRVAFELPDVYHTFRKGHRLMVHVQSSWFPLVDRNPQTFGDIPNAAPSDFKKATHRVYRSRDRASSITLLTLRGRALLRSSP